MIKPKVNPAILILIALSMFLASLPYLVGLTMRPPGYSLLGNSRISPGDTPVYYSYIEQGRHGHWLMADVFTSEPYRATIWEPLWWGVGQLANIFHLSTPWAFALARTAAIPLLVFALWWLSRWLWPDWRHQRAALWLAIFGGGLGGIVTMVAPHFIDRFGYVAIDQWVSEAFVNLTMMASAHFILTMSGTIFVFGFIEQSWEKKTWRQIGWASLIAAGTLIIHPFLAITWLLIWGGLTLGQWVMSGRLPWGYVGRWSAVLVACFPILLFYALQLKFDPISMARAVQNVNSAPAYLRTFLGLGLFLPLGIWGWWAKGHDRRWNFFGAWAALTLVAMYLPLSFSRRLSESLFIPWAFLSVGPLLTIWDAVKKRGLVVSAATGIVLGFLLFTAWPSVMWLFPTGYENEIKGRPGHVYFLSPDFQNLVKYLKNTPPARPLLASLHDSNILAGLAAHHVYYGHPVETAHYQEKSEAVDRFFGSATDAERQNFLMANHICYVVDGPQERAIGPSWRPAEVSFVRVAWTSPTIRLYQTLTCQ